MRSTALVMVSPSSDERFWSTLRDRVDTILEKHKHKRSRPCDSSVSWVESENGKRFREDSVLLIRGLDSAADSLSQLTNCLNAAHQGLSDLARPSATSLQSKESNETEPEGIVEPNAKRHCASTELLNNSEETGSQGKADPKASEQDKQIITDVGKSGNLLKAKNLAISMASKAASLARELKMIKSELCFMHERCALLEEENRRLRDGMEKSEDDDLVRLQLEALLAEKSRLANENANLTRENQCLHQLVEYHQLAIQEDASLSPSSLYDDEAIPGVCLDFSSPVGEH